MAKGCQDKKQSGSTNRGAVALWPCCIHLLHRSACWVGYEHEVMTKLSLGGVASKTMRSSDVNEQNPLQANSRVPPLCKTLLCIIKLSLLLLVSLLLVHTGIAGDIQAHERAYEEPCSKCRELVARGSHMAQRNCSRNWTNSSRGGTHSRLDNNGETGNNLQLMVHLIQLWVMLGAFHSWGYMTVIRNLVG